MVQETLAALEPGQTARVCGLTAVGEIRRRLQDMGLIPGTPVTCLHVSPLGDPKAYALRGAVVALRAGDAAGVRVER